MAIWVAVEYCNLPCKRIFDLHLLSAEYVLRITMAYFSHLKKWLISQAQWPRRCLISFWQPTKVYVTGLGDNGIFMPNEDPRYKRQQLTSQVAPRWAVRLGKDVVWILTSNQGTDAGFLFCFDSWWFFSVYIYQTQTDLSGSAFPEWLVFQRRKVATRSMCLMEKAMAPHPVLLLGKIPWMEEPGGLQSMGSLRVRHDWATSLSLFTFMHWRRKWQPTPVLLPGESQGQGNLVGCRLWGRRESDTTEAT